MKVIGLIQTCEACPSQWEGRTEDNRPVYIRHRWSYLSICLGPVNSDWEDAILGEEIYGEHYPPGDTSGYAGDITESELLEILDTIEYP